MYHTKSEPYRLWVIMLFQCWFIGCNKRTIQVVDVDNGGGEEGRGVFSWYLLLKFAAKLKLPHPTPPPRKKQHLSLPRV